MAKVSVNIDAQCAKILSDVREGRFSPLYLLMGDEPYYPEMVCDAIVPVVEHDNLLLICKRGDASIRKYVNDVGVEAGEEFE